MQLNRKLLESNKNFNNIATIGPLNEMPERVLQFGEGNFLRAFVDWHFNELNKHGLFNGKVVIVQPLKEGMIDAINKQNSLYTLLLRGIQNGKQIEKTEVITSVNRGINPYSDWKGFLNCAANPDLRFIVSNTTEAGISYNKIPFPENECPVSFPAKVAAFLYERYKKFSGAKNKGMIIIPCELIKDNGNTLHNYILQHAEDWNLESEFIRWIQENNYFYNTLVDRIVPGFPKDEIETLTKKLGYEDNIIVSAEIFHLWVIQGNKIASEELPFVKAGLNVVWTDDIQPYRNLKVRILNGAHTMFTIPSFLSGNDTVQQSVEDKVIGNYIEEGLFNEIIPTLDFPEEKKLEFAQEIIERFQNPFIKHYLISITLNSISKFKVRVLPSILEYFDMNKQAPEALSFSLASLIWFYRGYSSNKLSKNGSREFTLKDDEDVMKFFEGLKNITDYDIVVKSVLGNESFWNLDLNKIDGLAEIVSFYYKSIDSIGMKPAIVELLSTKTTD
ncbi:MAG: tagaturonate reductase [Ignavibacteriaceae bacterium]